VHLNSAYALIIPGAYRNVQLNLRSNLNAAATAHLTVVPVDNARVSRQQFKVLN